MRCIATIYFGEGTAANEGPHWVKDRVLVGVQGKYTSGISWEKVTLLIIFNVFLTTWHVVPFWQYYYRLTRYNFNVVYFSVRSLVDGLMVTLVYTIRYLKAARDNKLHVWLRLHSGLYLSWIIHRVSLVYDYEKYMCRFHQLTKSSMILNHKTLQTNYVC